MHTPTATILGGRLLWEAGGGTLPPSPSDLPPGERVGSSSERVVFIFKWRHPDAGNRNSEDTGRMHTASEGKDILGNWAARLGVPAFHLAVECP